MDGSIGGNAGAGGHGNGGSGGNAGADGGNDAGTGANGGSAGMGGALSEGGVGGTVSGHVLRVTPEPDATKVDTRATVELVLDRTALMSDAAGVELLAGGTPTPTTAELDGSTLMLVPDDALRMNTTYTVRVTSPLAASPATWTFTTADGAYRGAEDLFYAGKDPSETSRVIVADVAAHGSVVAAAYRTVGKVLVRRSRGAGGRQQPAMSDAGTPALSWQPEEAVADGESDHRVAGETSQEVCVGIDGTGALVVAWDAPAGSAGAYSIYAARSAGGSTAWSAATRLETDTDACTAADAPGCTASEPRLAVSSNGNAVVAWERHQGTASTVWAALLSGGKWSTATALSGATASEPSVTMNASGDAAVAWIETTSGYDVTKLRRYTAAKQTWDTARSLVFGNQTNARLPSVALNDAATLLVSWTAWPPGAPRVPGQGATRIYWEKPGATGGPSAGPVGAVNDGYQGVLGAKNDVLAAWGAPNPNSVNAAVHALPASGADVWPVGVTISKVEDYVALAVPRIDAQGRGLVAWRVGTDKTDPGIYSARYDGKQWSPAVPVVPGDVVGPLVALDDDGSGVIAWIPPADGALQAELFQ
ncbi:MAG TPA: Ig-like domain-containing protein [Polyangiaceae bacterium]|nr:Ig-like domain-containing protein [Polyangiaceae bacterium]